MAPSKCAKRAHEENEALEDPNDLKTKTMTPFGMGSAYIRTACLLLTMSFGTSLPFLMEFSLKNLKLFDEINRSQSTLDDLIASTVPPCSMHFNFELKNTAEVAATDKFKELVASVKQPITNCQKALKATVEASSKLKIDMLKCKEMENCLQFICYLAHAFLIS